MISRYSTHDLNQGMSNQARMLSTDTRISNCHTLKEAHHELALIDLTTLDFQ